MENRLMRVKVKTMIGLLCLCSLAMPIASTWADVVVTEIMYHPISDIDEDEFLELGPDEYFESDGLTLVEWADRVENCLPAERIEIHIEVTGAESRRFEIKALGTRYGEIVERCAARCL